MFSNAYSEVAIGHSKSGPFYIYNFEGILENKIQGEIPCHSHFQEDCDFNKSRDYLAL